MAASLPEKTNKYYTAGFVSYEEYFSYIYKRDVEDSRIIKMLMAIFTMIKRSISEDNIDLLKLSNSLDNIAEEMYNRLFYNVI